MRRILLLLKYVFIVLFLCCIFLAVVILPGTYNLLISYFAICIGVYLISIDKKENKLKWIGYLFFLYFAINTTIYGINLKDYFSNNFKSGVYEITKINYGKNDIVSVNAIDSETKKSIEFDCHSFEKNKNLLQEKNSYMIYYTPIYKDIIKIEPVEKQQISNK